MITAHYEFLQGYVDSGLASAITLNYNTNLSNIPDRAFELWKHFEKIELRTSIDAPGKINEYIRYPSNWDIVLRNLKKLTEVKASGEINLSLETITTVQIYNVFYLREFVDEIRSHDDINIDDMILHMLHDPRYFNITSLPDSAKDIIAKKIEDIGKETGYWQKQGQGVINHMYRNSTVDALDQFFVETRLMDRYREQKIETVMSELYELLKEYDPLQHAAKRIQKTLDTLDDALIVNVYDQNIEDTGQLEYTHVQILKKKDI